MVTFSHADQGTDETAWAKSGLAVAPELPLDATELAAMRFVVLAAHPDDETLGAGGLMSSLAALGAQVEVLLCTAGEGSHPDSPGTTPEQLARLRLDEFAAALATLGLADHWTFLGLPDRGLAAHTGTIIQAVRDAARRLSGDPERLVLVAPYRADGHGDHDALGAAAAETAARDGHALLEYPIWYWHWATPEDRAWRDWVRFHLAEPAATAKRQAMAEHLTQVAPLSPLPGDEALLSAEFLAHFSRRYEVFAWTPARNTSGAAHSSADAEQVFDAVHAASADPWDYTGKWYERRKRALSLAALPDESYERGLEVGCSIGTLTAELAERCRTLLAVDASGTAARHAAQRLEGHPGVQVEQRVLPADWPQGTFDLVVVSEVGYYLGVGELADLWDRIEATLDAGGTLLLCHWRHPISGWQLDGDTVHALARQRLGWQTVGLYQERDFILEVLRAPRPPGYSMTLAAPGGTRPEHSGDPDTSIRCAAVVIPAHNEEQHLERALSSVSRAADQAILKDPALDVQVVVVLDRCTDRSAAVAERFAAADPRCLVLPAGFGSVGKSRQAGVEAVLGDAGETIHPVGSAKAPAAMRRVWLANTDADSRVPENWLVRQLELADAGADVVLGSVEPDAHGMHHELLARWHARHARIENHTHVYGANLGVRASSYLAAGGFPAVEFDEDRILVDRLRGSGAGIVATDSTRVLTSGRTAGRAPKGFAGYLLALAQP